MKMKEKQQDKEKMKEETKIIKKSLTIEEEQQQRERKLQIRLAKARALKFEHEEKEKETSPPKEDKKDQEVKMTKSSTNEMTANFNDVLELDEDEEIRITREKLHSHKLNPSQQINEENVREPPQRAKEQIEEEEDSLDAFMSHIESNNNIIEILIN